MKSEVKKVGMMVIKRVDLLVKKKADWRDMKTVVRMADL